MHYVEEIWCLGIIIIQSSKFTPSFRMASQGSRICSLFLETSDG
jgi:hypothetical protein